MRTKRVDLGNGDYAELYVELRHGTSKRVQEIYRPVLQKPEVMALLNKDLPAGLTDEQRKAEEEKLLAELYKLVKDTADVLGAADAMIIGQVKEWCIDGTSLPVTQETLDNEISERQREILMKEGNALYGEVPLPSGGGRN